jgi:hypothetical protein
MADKGGIFRRWSKRYLIEYVLVLILGGVPTGICIHLARTATGATRMLLMVVPTAAVLLFALVVLRHLQRIDEFLRREMVESFAVAGAFTAIWTLIYGYFELAGFPRISVWWVWVGIAVIMNIWFFAKRAWRR